MSGPTARLLDVDPERARAMVELEDRILDRKKEGFSIPLKNWLRKDLEPLRDDLLVMKAIDSIHAHA